TCQFHPFNHHTAPCLIVWDAFITFSGEGKNGKIQTVCFEGVLTVNDAPALMDLIQQGIGPAKSMGCGLLSLAPL
ncbi:type I-E CRISPR-associated protein Cas6/Cse3/CasE, partial [Escherichia coli]|uniref:type I-E CRISPR-associated protein Cas6/Cse3/CasE n=1 Tax=Escherichia coli TaxID=562 RepID=UPI00201CBB84